MGQAGAGDDLSALFADTPAPAAPAAPMMVPGIASDVSFDEDDEAFAEPQLASMSIDNLFADDPEVQAQREIQAAQHESVRREAGYQSVGRTASTAKKLGQVRSTSTASVDQNLENLWDRP